MEKEFFSYRRLMFTTFVISGCSMVYELLISAVSSYLLGDSVTQFSITIGLYMCAMGIGSYLSKYIKKDLFEWFVFVEIAVGILGGSCAFILFVSNIYLTAYQLVMYLEIIGIGVLVGLEIPLLTRIIEENAGNLRITLSSIFSFDYIGGLAGSIAFPLILLPQLGYFSTAFLVGSLNLAISIFILFSYRRYIGHFSRWRGICILSLGIMLIGMLFSENLAYSVEQGLYRDKVVLSKQTAYQKVVMTKHKDDIRLYINGNIQFSSKDEYRYHEALVHLPMSAAEKKESVLVLGGGDGLAVREILKYPEVKDITLVDLDPQMIEICKTNRDIAALNENALESPKLSIQNEDAYRFLEENTQTGNIYDVIIVDLPDPNSETLNKLYTDLFYRLCANSLSKDGVMVVQSTSPYYAPDAYWCIHKTIKKEIPNVYPYHVQVPSFGDWGFQLASRKEIDIEGLRLETEGKFLCQDNVQGMFMFGEDERSKQENLAVNSLSTPKLLQYYLDAEKDWE
ncbi:MAG: polyamine aminopropyltransferase [Lachnospiraceae bacterium]|nr:polyamine aminopropyltransferase [Lachnospiraceae bacterium]